MADTQKKATRVKITKKITLSRPEAKDAEDEPIDMKDEGNDTATLAYSIGVDNPFQVDDAEDAVTVTLPGALDLSVSAAFKEALLYATSLKKTLKLDGNAVEQLSTPAIQLILAAQARLEETGQEAILLSPSQEFASAFDDLGLFSSLMKWKVEA